MPALAHRFTSEEARVYGLRFWEGKSTEERSAYNKAVRLRLLPRKPRPKKRTRHMAALYELLPALQPSASETIAMLADLSSVIGLPAITALSGLSKTHLTKIMSGKASCGIPSRKYVWVLWCAVLRPNERLSGFVLASVGRFTATAAPHHAGVVGSEARDRAPSKSP